MPEPDPVLMESLRDYTLQFCQRNFTSVRIMGFEEWLAGTSYNDQRKQQLRDVRSRVERFGINSKELTAVSSFIKSEFYPSIKHSRWINSTSDLVKVIWGPICKSYEQVVFDLPCFVKHVPVPKRARLVVQLAGRAVHCYATDFTAFESSFQTSVLESVEFVLFKHLTQVAVNDPTSSSLGVPPSTIMKILLGAFSGNHRLSMRNGMKATLKARRMSGDMHTSLGNGFTNMIVASYLCHAQGKECYGLFEGDDGLFCTDSVLTSDHYKRLGFNIKIEEHDDPCHASFCGLICSESQEIIKDPYKFMMGFAWTSSFITAGKRTMTELLRAKSMSAISEIPQCPILGVMSRVAFAMTRGHRARFVRDGYHTAIEESGFVVPDFCPQLSTRVLFQTLYGISVSHQLLVEAAIMRQDWVLVSKLLPPPPETALYAARFVRP